MACGDTDPHARHFNRAAPGSPRTGAYEPMRPPGETGFLRHSISDHALSTHDLAKLAFFLAGGMRTQLHHLEAARTRMMAEAIRLPHYCMGPEGEAMPIAYCHGVADYGRTKGVNGSYVGSTCAIRFNEQNVVGIAAGLNCWAPHVRDMAIAGATRIVVRSELPKSTAPAPPSQDLSTLEGDYEGLMLGADVSTLVREDDGLQCRIRRKGLPDSLCHLRRGPDGSFFVDNGNKDIAIAIANCPVTNSPYLMIGTSACRKLG